jgi:outer membrane lipoprotein carrier protein
MLTLTTASASAASNELEDPFAADREALAERLQTVATYAADFTQTVFGVRGGVLEQSQGYVRLDRPRFKWVVNDPYPQVLVTEGDKLKVYDPDLEQLTVRPLAEALEDTPVSLLTRDAVQLSRRFDVMRITDAEGDSFVIEPTADDTLYREIVLHFDPRGLTGLDILDHLGQRTEIRFQPDPDVTRIDPDTFTLKVPPGTDTVGEDTKSVGEDTGSVGEDTESVGG